MNQTLGQIEENLIPGPRMKKMQWKLPPGKIMISLLTPESINNIIRSWRGSWRRHACSLSSFFEYWQQQGKTIEQLAETEEPYLIIVNNISMKLDSKHTDASIFQSRTSLSHPYAGRDSGETVANIFSGKFTPLPDYIKGEMKEMLIDMLNPDPVRRPTAVQLLDSDLMQHILRIETEKRREGKKLERLSTELQNIAQELKQPIVGSEDEVQQILNKQEDLLKSITDAMSDKKDVEFRKRYFKAGVVDSLIYIINTYQLDKISLNHMERISCVKTQPFLWVLDYPGRFSGLHCLLEYSDLSNGSDRTKLKYFRQIRSMNLNNITPRHEKERDVVGTGKGPHLMSNTRNKQQTPFRLGCAFLWGDHTTRRRRLHYNNNSMQMQQRMRPTTIRVQKNQTLHGERATKQEVEALLARQQDMLGLELNEQGVKPSTGSCDPQE
ncbi:MAG: hypothetical protein EZS28_014020, partial [Streblomastix strix]